MILIRCFTWILCLCIAQVALAQDAISELHFEHAEKAFNDGDYKETLRKLDDTEKLTGIMSKTLYLRIVAQDRLLEQSGYTDEDSMEQLNVLMNHVDSYLEVMSEFGLDDRYREVYGIKEKIAEAIVFVKWGEMPEYKNGRAATELKNYAEAMDWYRQAAEQGNARAINNIGVFYQYGHGVSQDYKEAMVWFQKAAVKGQFAISMYNIGNLYFQGQGVSRDMGEALVWFKKAAEKENSAAMFMVGYIYALAQLDEEAMIWYKKSAEKGIASAMAAVGYLYAKKQEPVEALKWYRQAAEKGDATAMYNIAALYAKGEGINQDYGEAMTWLKKAHEAGNTDAKTLIAHLYEQGLGVPKNKKMAAEWRAKP